MVGRKAGIEEQLRRAIEESALTQYKLARMSGVHKGILSRFVRAERTINLATAARLAEALDLELRPATKPERQR